MVICKTPADTGEAKLISDPWTNQCTRISEIRWIESDTPHFNIEIYPRVDLICSKQRTEYTDLRKQSFNMFDFIYLLQYVPE